MTINIKDGISALLAIRLVERVLMEGKPVKKPTMDDRPVRQDQKSSAPVKQEKYRGKSLCHHEATESLAQG